MINNADNSCWAVAGPDIPGPARHLHRRRLTSPGRRGSCQGPRNTGRLGTATSPCVRRSTRASRRSGRLAASRAALLGARLSGRSVPALVCFRAGSLAGRGGSLGSRPPGRVASARPGKVTGPANRRAASALRACPHCGSAEPRWVRTSWPARRRPLPRRRRWRAGDPSRWHQGQPGWPRPAAGPHHELAPAARRRGRCRRCRRS